MKGNLQFRHILLAYDASEEADHAFEYARAFAQRYSAALEVLSVVATPLIGDDVETTAVIEEGRRKAERGLRRLKHITEGNALPIQFLTKYGRPTEQILQCAQELGADLIIMGHRPRSRLVRGISRSTLARVLQDAECPVLIVP
jgi:nucleotide-binding universal stress UspA family protein